MTVPWSQTRKGPPRRLGVGRGPCALQGPCGPRPRPCCFTLATAHASHRPVLSVAREKPARVPGLSRTWLQGDMLSAASPGNMTMRPVTSAQPVCHARPRTRLQEEPGKKTQLLSLLREREGRRAAARGIRGGSACPAQREGTPEGWPRALGGRSALRLWVGGRGCCLPALVDPNGRADHVLGGSGRKNATWRLVCHSATGWS